MAPAAPPERTAREQILRLFERTLPFLIRGLTASRIFFDRTRRAQRLKQPPKRWARPPKGFPPAHRHPTFELCFVLAGRCPFLLGEQRRELRRGDLVVLPPEVYHRELAAERCGPYRLLWLFCLRQGMGLHTQEHLGRGRFHRKTLKTWIHAFPEALRTAQAVDLELWEERPGAFHRVQGMLLQFCGQAERALREAASSGKEKRKEHEALQAWRAKTAAEFVRDHFAEALGLEDVARQVGISPGYLSALFSRMLGRSFTDFVAACRLEEARRLLADPTLSVKEIAHRVGFGNPFYFSRLFRKRTGCSPKQFRQRRAAKS